MKKFLAMLVAAMMVLSLVAIPVFADGEVVFAVENAPATATPGDEITVNLTVNGTFEAHVLNMQFNYNADAFEYVSHTLGDVLNQIIDLGGTQLVDATTIPGSMRLGVMMPTAAFTQSGTICSVTLRVKEGAANGASDLALVITEFKNFPTGGQATPIANVVNNATVTITGGSEPTPVPPTENPVTPEPGTATGWGFETDPFAEGWTIRDDDGDGYNWEWMDASASDYNVYEGTHCMASASYQNSAFGGGTALNPDNWLISPAFTAGSTVTFWYAGQDPSYSAEPFGVYVIANGTTSAELGHFTASSTYQQGSVDISAYAGQPVQVAFRHYNITDMFRLNLDLVEVSGGGSTPNTPVPPTEAPITENPNTPAPGGMATISLTAGDVFGDGSGYQMLLDADATAYGNEIPVEGPLTQSGNAPAGLYDAFEYKIPVNADGSTTTSNVVVNNTVTIQVPAGTYDWCLTNPTPGDRIWIASSQGNVGGRADDYTFEAGYTYNFTVYLLGQNDATDVEIIPGGGTPARVM